MTPRRRPKNRRASSPQGQAATLHRTARLVRAHLRRNQVDFAPLRELAATLGVAESVLRATVDSYPDLGICGSNDAQHLWWLPPATLAAGFQPVMLYGQLALRLASADPDHLPLHISGRHLGPAPEAELDLPELRQVSVGPLGYTIARLSLMAELWFTTSTRSDTSTLFSLIAQIWHTSPRPVWSSGRLHIHQGQGAQPPATRLELVVWADERRALHLVNLYPAGTHRTVFDQGAAE